jgi:hypothetical protein
MNVRVKLIYMIPEQGVNYKDMSFAHFLAGNGG